jgi:antirestriction protein ArdC
MPFGFIPDLVFGFAGIPTAYLGRWLTVLKEDKRAIFSAAAHAQRAADFLNSLQTQSQQEQEPESAAA